MDYVWDAGDNPLAIAFSGTQYPFTQRTVAYGYDAIGRLIQEDQGGTVSTWSYDWMGNRLDSGTSYNAVDELNAGSGRQYDLKGALSYTPSATGDPRVHFQYGHDDLLNRIDTEGSSPRNQTSMLWDADGQRVYLQEESTYRNWSFLYDTLAGVPAVLWERDMDADEDSNVTYYVREPGGELVASIGGSATAPAVRYYGFDALGSTVLLTDGSGNPVGAYAYGAWGQKLSQPAEYLTPYQFVGRLGYYTHSTAQGAARNGSPTIASLLQLGPRFYDPALGCYTQHGSPYAYADDQPVSLAGAKTKKRASKIPVDTPNRHYLNKCITACTSDDDVQEKMKVESGKTVGGLASTLIGAGLGGVVGACAGLVTGGGLGLLADFANSDILINDACSTFCSLRARKNGGIASYEYQAFDHWWSIVGEDFRQQLRNRVYDALGKSCNKYCNETPTPRLW